MRPADALVARRDRVLAERAKGRPQRAVAPVELVERRTVHSKTWDLGNGEHHLSQSVAPVHYSRDGGPLEEIDTAWVPDTDGIRMDSGPYRADILADGIGWRHTSRRGGWMEMRLVAVNGQPVASLIPPRVDGDQVTWDAVAPGVDIRVVAFPGQSEAFKRLTAPTELEWQVTEGGPATRRPKLQETLVGWDRRGDRLEILTERAGDRFRERWTGRVSRVVDPASRRKGWVVPEDAGYVVVDASITEDVAANVDDGFCTNNYNWLDNYAAWNVGRYFGTGSQSVAGVRWRTVAIPNGATVSAATLTINVTADYGAGNVRIYGADVDDAPLWTATFPRNVAKTTAMKQWTPTATGVQTVDVLGPVSEVLGRAGWASGNDLGIALFPNGVGAGQVVVRCEDYAAAGTDSAQLDVTFTTGGGPTDVTPADASHNHTADQPALTQVHDLAVNPASHGHAAEQPSLENAPAPEKVADRGTAAQTNATASVVDLPSGSAIDVANNVLIARLSHDNSGLNGAATTVTPSDPRGNTWTVLDASNRDPGAANAGVTGRIAYCVPTTPYQDGDDLTFTFGNTCPTAVAVVEEWKNLDRDNPVAVAQLVANGTSATPSVAITPTGKWQLAYGNLAVEGIIGDTYNQDSDTVDGTWVSLTSLSTGNVTPTNNSMTRGAYKVVSGTTAQTWNPGITSRDWAAAIIVFNAAPLPAQDASHGHAADQPSLTQVHALAVDSAAHGHTANEASVTQVYDVAVEDATHGHTTDSPTLVQAHELAAADAEHGHVVDEPALTQDHSLTTADASHGHAADSPALTQAHSLAADDSEHGHTATAPTLTQAHAVAADDANHANVAEEPTVAHIHELAPADSVHGHTADAPAFTQVHGLAANGAAHVQTADEPSLTQAHGLSADDTEHGHSADSPTLTQTHELAADGSTHQHAADASALTQAHAVAVVDSTHAHVADQPTLSGAGDILADNASHGQVSASAALTQTHDLPTDGAAHSHAAEAPTLAQVHALASDSAAHGHAVEQPALTQAHAVAAADALHGQTVDEPDLTVSGALVAQDASHGHAAGQPTLTGTHELATDHATHATAAEEPTVGDLASLVAADASHGLSTGSPTLGQQHTVAVDVATHAQLADQVALTQLHLLVAAGASHVHVADEPMVTDVSPIVPGRLTPGRTRPSLTPGATSAALSDIDMETRLTPGFGRPSLTPGGVTGG